MSLSEFSNWKAYVKKHGPLHPGMNLERGFALIASTLVRVNGGKAKMTDYMPHYESPDNDVATPQDIIRILTGARVR